MTSPRTTPSVILVDGRGRSVAEVSAAIDSVLAGSAGTTGTTLTGIGVFVDAASLDQVVEATRSAPVTVQVTVPPSDDAPALEALLASPLGRSAEWLLVLDAAGVVVPGALDLVASAIDRFDVDVVYGDGIVDGERVSRPTFSPIRLRSQDYLGALRGFRIAAIRAAGGFGPDISGAYAYDLALRLGADPTRVLRIPERLSESLTGVQQLTGAHRRAIARHLSTTGIVADIDHSTPPRIRYPLVATPLVSIIIPTRGSSAVIRGRNSVLVVDAVRGIAERSTYPALEFVVVADDETPQAVIDELVDVGGDRLKLVRFSSPFNFSAKMNRGAVHAAGEYLLMLNDDVELISPDWIETMLGLAVQPGVGLVGGLLLFEDGTVQHGGHLYEASWAGHIAFEWEPDRDDLLGSMGVDREVSGVTAACSLVSADLFWRIGGFSVDYAGNYNDVDFALKVRSEGDSVVWTPHARLFHFESKSRVATVLPRELETLRAHWGTRLTADPYWR